MIKIITEQNKKYLDNEYQTSFLKEKEWLLQHGIRYVFVKDYKGISVYKYKKTPQLFQLLSLFYIEQMK